MVQTLWKDVDLRPIDQSVSCGLNVCQTQSELLANLPFSLPKIFLFVQTFLIIDVSFKQINWNMVPELCIMPHCVIN